MIITTELNQEDIEYLMQAKWGPVCLCVDDYNLNPKCTMHNDITPKLEVAIPISFTPPTWNFPNEDTHRVLYRYGERVAKGISTGYMFYDPIKVIEVIYPQ